MRYRLFLFAIPIIIGVLLVLVPAFQSPTWIYIGTTFFISAIFVMSFDLLGGYTGLYPFGHAAFFAAGSYTTALLSLHGVTQNFWLIIPISIFVAALLAGIYGLIALRTSGMYFLLITFALGTLTYALVHTWRSLTKGDWGIAGIPRPEFAISSINFYYFAFGIFVICYLLLYFLTKSSFGRALVGIRENELRMRTLGHNTWVYKYVAFIIAGAFAGVAGFLYASYSRHVGPSCASVQQSMMPMLMVMLGGPGTLLGGVIGAAIITLLEHFLGLYIMNRWPLILGVIFIAFAMYSRGGVGNYLLHIWTKVEERYGTVNGRGPIEKLRGS